MIKLQGTAQKEYSFPADPQTAIHYFTDFQRIVTFLPHIKIDTVFDDNALRLHYQTVELGAYTISLYADVISIVNTEKQQIVVKPLMDKTPVEDVATLSTATSYGFFASTAQFFADGDKSKIDYKLKLGAKLPKPRGLRMMPGRVVNRIAQSISEGRVNEIAEGFFSNAIEAFPEWLANQQPIY